MNKTNISDIFDIELFERHINEKNINLRSHPDNDDLVIANYSQTVQFNALWDDVTLHTRGLIFNRDTGDIIARPWKKFFNHSQEEADDLNNANNIEVTDKMDGSLIIGWRDRSGTLRASTKGSFASEMVPIAEDILSGYNTDIDPDWTPLFEVIYPENRIVVNYRDTRDLFALGAVNIATGEIVGPHDDVLANWNGPRTKTFTASSLDEVLSMSPRDNAEGVIVRDRDNGGMIKIKQEDYIKLHRVATNVTTLNIWDHLQDGTINEMIEVTPDELYDDLHDHINKFTNRHEEIKNEIIENRNKFLSEIGVTPEEAPNMEKELRGHYARTVMSNENKSMAHKIIAATFFEEKLDKTIWKELRPTESEREYLGYFQKNKK